MNTELENRQVLIVGDRFSDSSCVMERAIGRLIDALEEKRKSSGIIQFDPAGFQEKCLSALSVLKSDADMETKVSVSHNLIEKIECDNINKVLTIYFYS